MKSRVVKQKIKGQKEDMILLKLMKGIDPNKRVSRETIMNKLRTS